MKKVLILAFPSNVRQPCQPTSNSCPAPVNLQYRPQSTFSPIYRSYTLKPTFLQIHIHFAMSSPISLLFASFSKELQVIIFPHASLTILFMLAIVAANSANKILIQISFALYDSPVCYGMNSNVLRAKTQAKSYISIEDDAVVQCI